MLQRNLLVLAAAFVVSLPSFAQTLIFQTDANSQPDPAIPSQPQPSTINSPTHVPVQQALPVVTQTVNSAGNSELFFMIEQLQQEVRELRGLVEEQAYAINQMQTRSKDRYRDLDARLLDVSKKVSNRPASVPSSAVVAPSANVSSATADTSSATATTGASEPQIVPAANASKPATPEQKKAYRAAYELIKEKQFEQAIDALHDYIEAYPEGDLTGNAYYWLGEVYLVIPKLEQAQSAFKYVVAGFPGHRKAADALYKLGVTIHQMGDNAQAQTYLDQVQQVYPDSSAAKLAKDYSIKLQ